MSFDVNNPGDYANTSVLEMHRERVTEVINRAKLGEWPEGARLLCLNYHPEKPVLVELEALGDELFAFLKHAPELYMRNSSLFLKEFKRLSQEVGRLAQEVRKPSPQYWATQTLRDYVSQWVFLDKQLQAVRDSHNQEAGLEALTNILSAVSAYASVFQYWIENKEQEERALLEKALTKGARIVDKRH